MDTDEIRARVGTRIRELAARRKLGLNELADRAGVTHSLFYAVLSGERAATTDTLTKLAEALRVEPMEFLRPPRAKKTKAMRGS